jgi:hypothetical protein
MAHSFKLDQAQQNLNAFLWASDLAFAILSQTDLLDSRTDQRPHDAFPSVKCAALIPTNKKRPRFDRTVRQLKKQLEEHINLLCPAVLAQFFASFEEFVRERFPALNAANDDFFQVGRPVKAWKAIANLYPRRRALSLSPEHALYSANLLLKADLLKAIRNAYAHEGSKAIPDTLDHPLLAKWEQSVRPNSVGNHTQTLIAQVKEETIARSIRQTEKAYSEGKTADLNVFYAIFTFTNLRNLATELDRQFEPLPIAKGQTLEADTPWISSAQGFLNTLRKMQGAIAKHDDLHEVIDRAKKAVGELKKALEV